MGAGGQTLELEAVLVEGDGQLSATVPADVPAAEYQATVTSSGRTSAPGGRFTVYTGALEITILDVDQGDAALVRAPNGRTLLVDGGKPGQGLARVIPFLGRAGAGQPDFVVVSHFDDDHLGGVVEYLAGLDRSPEPATSATHGWASSSCRSATPRPRARTWRSSRDLRS